MKDINLKSKVLAFDFGGSSGNHVLGCFKIVF